MELGGGRRRCGGFRWLGRLAAYRSVGGALGAPPTQQIAMASRKEKRPLIGAHVSIAGGVSQSLARGRQIGCDCIQIFTKSSRQWAAKPYSGEEIEAFKSAQAETGIKMVVAHDSYLLNLGAPEEKLRK